MGRERRDLYSLVGPEADRAAERGLVGAAWFKSDVPRKRMKELMQRSDARAVRDTVIWLGGIVVLGIVGSVIWIMVSPWLAAPVFVFYGLLYGSASDSRWHETGHGTAFKTRWMDGAVYEIASFMMMRDPTVWRWTHTRHHTDTLIVGRDPEIAAMRPARLARIVANFFGLYDVPKFVKVTVQHAFGRLTPDEAEVVPAQEQSKIYRNARLTFVIYAATVTVAIITGSMVPLLLIGGPRVYGAYMGILYGLTQHAGMGEDVLDHRLNTRTIKMCWFNRFLYWNMNYHVEHHMFPMVPYHRLPQLHEEIKHDTAEVYPSIWAAYRELVPAVLRQLKDQSYYVRRELPSGAAPFNEVSLA